MRLFIFTTLALMLALPLAAQDYEKGLAAAERGDYAAALEEWRPLAEQGHAKAMRGIGVMYFNGHGVKKDRIEAVVWYRKAASLGDLGAQTDVGTMYANGTGVYQS